MSKDMVTTRMGEHTSHAIRVDRKMLDDMNNFQHIGSNIIKRLQHNILYYVVQETFRHCDRITDKIWPLFTMKIFVVATRRSMYIDRQDGRHEFEGMLPLQCHPPGIHPSLLKSRHRAVMA